MIHYRTEPDGTSGNRAYAGHWQGVRLSRLSHPRATLLTIVLLTTVFLLFGLVASSVAGL